MKKSILRLITRLYLATLAMFYIDELYNNNGRSDKCMASTMQRNKGISTIDFHLSTTLQEQAGGSPQHGQLRLAAGLGVGQDLMH